MDGQEKLCQPWSGTSDFFAVSTCHKYLVSLGVEPDQQPRSPASSSYVPTLPYFDGSGLDWPVLGI